MSIRNFIDVPDDQVPAWVRERREADRAARHGLQRRTCSCGAVLANRNYLLGHLDVKTDHQPIVEDWLDRCLVRHQMCKECALWPAFADDLCQMCAHRAAETSA